MYLSIKSYMVSKLEVQNDKYITMDGLFRQKYCGDYENKKSISNSTDVDLWRFYDDVIVRNERVPNSVKKYINREVIYELSYANAQIQKSWEEYAAAQYQSSLNYTEKAQEHIDKALQLHKKPTKKKSTKKKSTKKKSTKKKSIKKKPIKKNPIKNNILKKSPQIEQKRIGFYWKI